MDMLDRLYKHSVGIPGLIMVVVFALVLVVFVIFFLPSGATIKVGDFEYSSPSLPTEPTVNGAGNEHVRRDKTSPSDLVRSSLNDFTMHFPQSETRVYLNLNPKEMENSIAEMTGLQAARMIEQTYAGKWMRFTAPLKDVLSYKAGHARLIFSIEDVVIRVELLESQYDKTTHLRAGDSVTVEGEFESMDRIGPDFVNGELINTVSE